MRKKLILIDGHSILNRAFYGVPDLTNAEGIHTNALYGFLNIMFRFIDEEKPDYITVAFDLSAPTFRHTASLTVSGQGSFFIVRPDFRISTACAADHRQKSLHTEFITVYRLFLSFYKSLYNCSYFLAELSHEKSAAMPRSTILFHSRLWL